MYRLWLATMVSLVGAQQLTEQPEQTTPRTTRPLIIQPVEEDNTTTTIIALLILIFILMCVVTGMLTCLLMQLGICCKSKTSSSKKTHRGNHPSPPRTSLTRNHRGIQPRSNATSNRGWQVHTPSPRLHHVPQTNPINPRFHHDFRNKDSRYDEDSHGPNVPGFYGRSSKEVKDLLPSTTGMNDNHHHHVMSPTQSSIVRFGRSASVSSIGSMRSDQFLQSATPRLSTSGAVLAEAEAVVIHPPPHLDMDARVRSSGGSASYRTLQGYAVPNGARSVRSSGGESIYFSFSP